MVSRGDDIYTIWPLYFDRSYSRKNGRKIAKKFAVEKPKLDVLLKAAQSLGLHHRAEKNMSHPSRPYLREGRILIEKKDNKPELLRQLAQRF